MVSTLEGMLPLLAELSRSREVRRSLASLSEQAGWSPSYFQRAFSRLIKESPKQYTLRLQLELAAARLLTSERSVLQVALESGFDSHEGFTRAFRRRFGASPKDIRKHTIDLEERERFASLVLQLGPCLRLYRVSLNEHSTRIHIMNYDITKQKISSVHFLCQSARCSHEQVAQTLGKLLPAAFELAMRKGLDMVGPPVAEYVEWGPGMVTLRAGVPVKEGSEGEGELKVVVLPASEAAVTVHTGPYDGLGDAHAAIEQYLDAEGLTKSGAPREVYLTDPGEVPDPKDWKTQVLWPVA